MEDMAILIDYDYCTGCHSCEVACKVEHGFKTGEFGIQVFTMGPREIEPDHWEFTNIPVLTERCDLCEERVSMGKLPTCVHHCQALVIEYGPIQEMAAKMTKKKMVLYTPTRD